VLEDESSRYLRFDNSLQSAMWLERPFGTRYRYTDFFHLGLAYKPDARNLLMIGLGGGSAVKRLWREFPRLQVHAVEIDPVVVDVARRYFALPDHPRLQVDVQDGRRFLAKDSRRWDVIALDAFYSDSIPFHLVTREFLELARSRLAPGGVIVANTIGAIEGADSRLFRAMLRTYRSTFPTVLVHPEIEFGEGSDGDDLTRNLIIVATDGAAPSRRVLADRWGEIRRRVPETPELRKPIMDRHDGPIPLADVPLLTDDYAPTDSLLMLYQ
jgi:predicted O-methyltransferase YrrM